MNGEVMPGRRKSTLTENCQTNLESVGKEELPVVLEDLDV